MEEIETIMIHNNILCLHTYLNVRKSISLVKYNLKSLYRVSKKDLKQVAITLSKSFKNDPLSCYMYPDTEKRLKQLYHYFIFRVRFGITHGEVYATSKYFEGIAVWLPSNKTTITRMEAMKVGGWKLYFQLGMGIVSRMEVINHFTIEFRKNVVKTPYWYLAPMGVDPVQQGKGFARILLLSMLNRLDKEKIDCFLETQTERNVEIYKRYGFEVNGKTKIPGTELEHYGMIRKYKN